MDEYGPNPAEIYMLKSQERQDAFCEYTALNKQSQSLSCRNQAIALKTLGKGQ